MRRRVVYRTMLIITLFCSISGLLFVLYYNMDKRIPNTLHLRVNEKEEFDFSLPIEAGLAGDDLSVINIDQGKLNEKEIKFNLERPFSIQSSALGEYKIDLKLFGIFRYKTIDVSVINQTELIPSGEPIGIYIESDGVLVLGTSEVLGEDGQNYEPATDLIKSGDYICQINGKSIESKEELIEEIQKNGASPLYLIVRRANKDMEVCVTPIKSSEGDFKIGTWIRDNTQGIGTLTYVGEDGKFGALGHGITDVDTNILMEISQGTLYNAGVLDIVKGENGSPGEIVGMIKTSYGNDIGSIAKNTNQGIFGTIRRKNYSIDSKKAIPIGLKQDVQVGKATILCSVEGTVKEYEIKITKVELNTKNLSKGLVIEITDPNLLAVTNGIIQGMSGSPIIQNGKLIGAVTHVFIQDSTKGYGTFIENMLKTAG